MPKPPKPPKPSKAKAPTHKPTHKPTRESTRLEHLRDHEFLPDCPGWYLRFRHDPHDARGPFFDIAFDTTLPAVLGPCRSRQEAEARLEQFALDFAVVLYEARREAGVDPLRRIDPAPAVRTELETLLTGLDPDTLARILRFAAWQETGRETGQGGAITNA